MKELAKKLAVFGRGVNWVFQFFLKTMVIYIYIYIRIMVMNPKTHLMTGGVFSAISNSLPRLVYILISMI
jgi:hypothetical protein